jgi:hypothetical protein
MSNSKRGSFDLPIVADFQNADPEGRVRLNCRGTRNELIARGLTLRPGDRITIYDEEFAAEGIVETNLTEGILVAIVDWTALWSHEGKSPYSAFQEDQ